MLEQITPVIISFNEAPNLGRTLERLRWARRVVLVDSGSTDDTVQIASSFANVALFTRSFDGHAEQWAYATQETGIDTDWVLRLDADYLLTDELVAELATLDPATSNQAYRIHFDLAVFGRRLRRSLYPPNVILFRRGTATVFQQGHTERWRVGAPIGELKGKIIHDDRKPVSGWVGAQVRYMRLEHEMLKNVGSGWKRRLRLMPPLTPIAVFFYTLFGKGLILDGRAGLFYALERTCAEMILSLLVLEERLQERRPR